MSRHAIAWQHAFFRIAALGALASIRGILRNYRSETGLTGVGRPMNVML
jgi:hypothetical protein